MMSLTSASEFLALGAGAPIAENRQVPWNKRRPPKWHENPTYLLMILGLVIALLLFGWSF